jgi:hypothetical protein
MPVTFLANLYLLYDNLFIDGLSIGAGVFNIFNNDFRYIQPYAAGHDPLPSGSSEFLVHASYSLGF